MHNLSRCSNLHFFVGFKEKAMRIQVQRYCIFDTTLHFTLKWTVLDSVLSAMQFVQLRYSLTLESELTHPYTQ